MNFLEEALGGFNVITSKPFWIQNPLWTSLFFLRLNSSLVVEGLEGKSSSSPVLVRGEFHKNYNEMKHQTHMLNVYAEHQRNSHIWNM